MPKALACGLLICTAFPAGRGVAAQELTLDDYFAAAVRRSEVIATQSELIRQAEERYKQATAALLPTISGYGSYLWQDPLPSGAPSTPSNLSRQPLAKVTATQPLFRGFREIAAMRQTEALISAQSDDYQNARVLLLAREGNPGTRAHRPLTRERTPQRAEHHQHASRPDRAAARATQRGARGLRLPERARRGHAVA
ncbi:MAG: hypothetical protein AMS22_09195 [Thiotrichales bacterium SG8_50]|nr:MAG: hypothetical protein AMS22_09195 [Thiotrichales bacterium SG8_50]